VTATATPQPTATATPTSTPTSTPTETPTPTATVVTARVDYPYGLNLRREADTTSELLLFVPAGTDVILLDGRVTNDDLIWQQVSVEGVVGWVLAEFLGSTAP
jgi:hypothetical protein